MRPVSLHNVHTSTTANPPPTSHYQPLESDKALLGVVFAVPWLVEPESLRVELGPWPAVALVCVVGGLIDEAEDDVVEVDLEGSDGDIAVRDRHEGGQPVRQDLFGGLDGCGAVAPDAGETEVRAGVVPAFVEEMEHRV